MSYNVFDLSVNTSEERKGKEGKGQVGDQKRQVPTKSKHVNVRPGLFFLVLLLFLFSLVWAQDKTCSGCPAGFVSGQNLIQNGDFEDLTQPYTIPVGSDTPVKNCNPVMQIGQYCVTTNPTTLNPGWITLPQTNLHGNFLVCDGYDNLKTLLFEKTIPNILPNNTYVFSAWFTNLFPRPNWTNKSEVTVPVVECRVNGVPICTQELSKVDGDWHPFSGTWQSGINVTSALVQVFLLPNPSFLGNDVGMDDISFSLCEKDCMCGKWNQTTVHWCTPFYPYLKTMVIPGCNSGILPLCSVCVCRPIILNFDYWCNPHPICIATYSWRITGPNGYFKSGTSNPCQFVPTMPGIYSIHIKTFCGGQECCPACTINLEVIEIVQCEAPCHGMITDEANTTQTETN